MSKVESAPTPYAGYIASSGVPGDDNKRDPERENLAVLTIAAQTANLIHIRVTFIAVTR